MVKPAHYRGTYQTRSTRLRRAAHANPNTRCWRCGLTLPEHKPGDRWEAGHLIDGDPNSPLRPEARSCNRAASAAATNAKRRARRARRTSRTWRL